MTRRPLVLGAAVLSAALLAGCGGSSSSPSSHTRTARPPSTGTGRAGTHATRTRATRTKAPRTHSTTPTARPPARRLPAIGSAQTVHAHTAILSVRVLKVIDPLTDSGAAALPGTRPVGVQVSILDTTGSYDSTASGDWSLRLSPASADAMPLFIKHGVCATPLNDFESEIGAGGARAGCVGFSLPAHARIVGVRFAPHAQPTGSVQWSG